MALVGVELLAVGALLFVVDVIAYSRYREVKDRRERLSDLDRTARIKGVLHEEVVEPVRDLPAEELTRGKEVPAVFEDSEFFPEAPAEFHAEQEAPAPAPEGDVLFLPPSQPGLAAAFSPLTGYPAEPEGPHVETRMREFEDFQRRSDAELSMLRASLEDLHGKLHELSSPVKGDESKDAKNKKLPSLRTLKSRRDKLERELKVLQRRFMKRQVDVQTFGRLTADLQRELNRVHADALERAEAVRRK